jgi:outer membrane lipoprotein SlyB
MTTMIRYGAALGVVGLFALGGCETMNDPFGTSGSTTTRPGTVNSGNAHSGYGVVHSIELVQQAGTGSTGIGGSGIGIGAVAGAVIGGVLGNQVGGGTGQTVATVAGAAGGAYVGHEIESRQQKRTVDVYKYTIRMDGGSYQAFTQNTNTDFRVGDRVRIDNGVMQRY